MTLVGFMTGTATGAGAGRRLPHRGASSSSWSARSFGLVGGYVIIQLVNRTSLEPALYPIMVLAMALVIFTLTGLAGGSGFLAVYVAGLLAGNVRMRHAVSLRRFQTGTTWFAQIAMFVTLGLLATPSQFSAVLVPALLLAAFLTFVARPLAIWVCLIPFGFTRHEIAFIAWVGLRGAVSILLAILPIIAGLPNATAIFNTAFIVVLASLLVQGWTIRPMARFLGLIVPSRHGPVDRIELELPGRGDHEIVAYKVHPESPIAHGERIPRWARPSLVIRDGRSMRPHNFGRPKAGDQIYIITTPRYLPLLDRLFAASSAGRDRSAALRRVRARPGGGAAGSRRDVRRARSSERGGADRRATIFAASSPATSRRATASPLARSTSSFAGVDEDHAITEVGLAVEHATAVRPRIPFFQTPREIVDFFRRRPRPETGAPVQPGPEVASVEPIEVKPPPPGDQPEDEPEIAGIDAEEEKKPAVAE